MRTVHSQSYLSLRDSLECVKKGEKGKQRTNLYVQRGNDAHSEFLHFILIPGQWKTLQMIIIIIM